MEIPKEVTIVLKAFGIVYKTINWKLVMQFCLMTVGLFILVRFVVHNYVGIVAGAAGMLWLARQYHRRSIALHEEELDELQAWYEAYYLPNPQHFSPDEQGYPDSGYPVPYTDTAAQLTAAGYPDEGYPGYTAEPGYGAESGYADIEYPDHRRRRRRRR